MASPSVLSSLELHGAAASSSRHSVVHLDSSAILYASNCIINIATPHSIIVAGKDTSESNNDNDNTNKIISDHDSVVYSVRQTIRTESLSRADNDWSRSITAITLLNPQRHGQQHDQQQEESSSSSSAMKIVACAFSDGTITTFSIRQTNSQSIIPEYEWNEHIIVGTTSINTINHTDTDTQTNTNTTTANSDPKISIADITGCYSTEIMRTNDTTMNTNTNLHDNIYHLKIIAASAKGVHCYHHSIHTNSHSNTHTAPPTIACIGNYPTSTVEITTIDNQILLTLGTALPRNNRVHFYTMPLDSDSQQQQQQQQLQGTDAGVDTAWKHQGSVMGHLDWISCLDWNFDLDLQQQQQKQ